MAGVRKALKAFLNSWKAYRSAKLTLSSDKGDMSVILDLNLGHYCEIERRVEAGRSYQGLHGSKSAPASSAGESEELQTQSSSREQQHMLLLLRLDLLYLLLLLQLKKLLQLQLHKWLPVRKKQRVTLPNRLLLQLDKLSSVPAAG